MWNVGIIGSGRVGGTVARLAIAGGCSVVVSNSRGPETLTELVADLGPRARAATPAEAAEAGDLVVISVPVRAYREVPVEPLKGRTVLDTINYDPRLHGHIPELDAASITTSEMVQQHLHASHVVKVFNNIFFQTLRALARPRGAADRTALPIAGDAPDVKAEAARFVDAIGFDTVDGGPLAEGWRWQPGTPAHSVYAGETIQVANPGNAEKVRNALAAATR
ncbi:NADPH-dependent F420 reductase [Pseudonocardia sp. MH-G8]|uniref:NADPH-dependent F420 reductase n=1 Tax=Pseudonocardia sp. MH-G8 TaxID=1854588 RepID=UPI000BA115CE|nr:NAD(P)-binding domain-containing protein [Pseudonocardia sp. MH-G8]OZM79104.1 NADP oxidoreductase [Pseudonocardia sp. MH-G8]